MTYISKDFQVGHLSYYRLLVNAQHDFDRVCILDDYQAVIAYHKYASVAPTNEVLSLLSLPFPKIDVIVPHHSVSLIPQEIYDPADMETYADYIELKSNTDIIVKEIDGFGVNALYQFDAVLYNRWKKIYPDATFVPDFFALFDLASFCRYSEGALAFIQFQDSGIVNFLLTKNGELLFFNSFAVKAKEDLIYYLLLVQKRFGLTHFFQKIYTVGHPLDPSWYLSLHRFCEELVTDNVISGPEFPEELADETKNEIDHLFYSTACVLSVAK